MLVGEFLVEEFKFTLKFSHELFIDAKKHIYKMPCDSEAHDSDNRLSFNMQHVCKNRSMETAIQMFERIKYAIDKKQVILAFNDELKNELLLTLTWGSDRGVPSIYHFILKNKAKNTMLAIREKEIKILKRKYEELAESVGLINKVVSDVKNDKLEPGEIVEHGSDTPEHN